MKKRLDILTLIFIPFLLFGCNNHQPNDNSDTTPDKNEIEHDTELNENNYWNVENVDVSEINAKHKLIAFTYDDGPSIENQTKLLEVFDNFNSKNTDFKASATFFYIGKNIDETKYETMNAAYKAGFELANHTYNHKNLTELDENGIKKEINDGLSALKKAVPEIDKALVRLPGGNSNEKVLANVNYPMINWSSTPKDLDTRDWDGATKDKIYQQIIDNAVDGGIVLMHQNIETCIQVTKQVLPVLKSKGYQVCSVSKLIKARNLKVENNKVYWGLTDLI